MNISSLVDILDGHMISEPSISFIYSIKINPSKVKQGDLFIAGNIEDIQQAVENGAFAIIFDKNTSIIDEEIAWIKVSCIKEAIIKIIRYKLSYLDIQVYYCDFISYDYLKLFLKNTKQNITIIPKDFKYFVNKLDDIAKKNVLFSCDKDLLSKIYPKYELFNTKVHKITNLTKHSIFETSFCFENEYFNRYKISTLYLNSFLDVYIFLKKRIDTHKLKHFIHLQAIFIDKHAKHVDFGKTNKLILVQKNISLIKKEFKYLKKSFKYGKVICFTKENISLDKQEINLTKESDIKKELKQDFNLAYFAGFEFDEIQTIISCKENSLNLF